MRLILTLAALVLMLVTVAACGDDDDDDTGGDATPDATEDTGGDDGGATFVEIDAADFSFIPASTDVSAGADLTFVLANTGEAPHTLDIYADEDYSEPVDGASTGNIPGGTVGEFTVSLEAGDYFFRCELHPSQMQGTITAQ